MIKTESIFITLITVKFIWISNTFWPSLNPLSRKEYQGLTTRSVGLEFIWYLPDSREKIKFPFDLSKIIISSSYHPDIIIIWSWYHHNIIFISSSYNRHIIVTSSIIIISSPYHRLILSFYHLLVAGFAFSLHKGLLMTWVPLEKNKSGIISSPCQGALTLTNKQQQ